jgi:hypothetical protein
VGSSLPTASFSSWPCTPVHESLLEFCHWPTTPSRNSIQQPSAAKSTNLAPGHYLLVRFDLFQSTWWKSQSFLWLLYLIALEHLSSWLPTAILVAAGPISRITKIEDSANAITSSVKYSFSQPLAGRWRRQWGWGWNIEFSRGRNILTALVRHKYKLPDWIRI